MQNYYADILIKLYDARVKFILAGGVASVLHGVERLTLGIDIAVEMSEDNLGRFKCECAGTNALVLGYFFSLE
jgi:hypothetical protein